MATVVLLVAMLVAVPAWADLLPDSFWEANHTGQGGYLHNLDGSSFRGGGDAVGTVDPAGPSVIGRPGDTFSLRAFASGGDLSGVLTIDGLSFETGCSGFPLGCAGTALVEFMAGTVTAPAFDAAFDPAALSAPFTLMGSGFGCLDPTCAPEHRTQFTGSGIATVDLIVETTPIGPLWSVQDVRYVFTPEPTTLALLLSGSALLIWRRRLRP